MGRTCAGVGLLSALDQVRVGRYLPYGSADEYLTRGTERRSSTLFIMLCSYRGEPSDI
jgi:hypothetical protein